MKRFIADQLDEWLNQWDRKPLVLRGARQVGKTWLVRDLAKRTGKKLIEINFEQSPQMANRFDSQDPKHILALLSLDIGESINPKTTILFLDEIQAQGHILGVLRYFYESCPELPVIAAGSLLELCLSDHNFSMPVGRISYLYVEPMNFCEFLYAHGQEILIKHLKDWYITVEMDTMVHEKAWEWFERYLQIGGMPAVVFADIQGDKPSQCRRKQHDLLSTYRDDFPKYGTRMDHRLIDTFLAGVIHQLGKKIIFARISDGIKQHQARSAFELLTQSRLVTPIKGVCGNGVPLRAEVNDRFNKCQLLDIGLAHALLGTPAMDAFPKWNTLNPSITGPLMEQAVGQELKRRITASLGDQHLCYWQREGGRPGKIDILMEWNLTPLPVEIKSGANGSMKALHQFMYDKNLSLAVRFDSNPPSLAEINLKTNLGNQVCYQLLSLPPYLAWNIETILHGLETKI
jgi:uncharacterized protein